MKLLKAYVTICVNRKTLSVAVSFGRYTNTLFLVDGKCLKVSWFKIHKNPQTKLEALGRWYGDLLSPEEHQEDLERPGKSIQITITVRCNLIICVETNEKEGH